jgi:hypothetical protein
MALIIKATAEKEIKISGTDLTIPQVYGRVEFVGRSNGTTLEIAVVTYVSKETFEQNQPVFTNIQAGTFNATIEAGEEQSLNTAHKYGKIGFEQLGYEVVIDLI